MLGIKYVIENKLQNNSNYNTNTRITLENPIGKNQPSIIDLLLDRPKLPGASLMLTLAHYNGILQSYL